MNNDPLLQVFFEEAAERLADYEEALVQLEKSPQDTQLLNRIFRCAHTLKGNSAMLGFQDIVHFTHALEDLLDQLRSGRRTVTPAVADTLLASEDVLRGLVTRAREGISEATPEESRTTEQVLKALHALLEESPASIAQPTPAASVAETNPPADATARPATGPEPTPTRFNELEKVASLRVPIERVDRLVNLVGELVIAQSMVSQTVANFTPEKLGQLKEAVAQMDRHARELHERMMAVRMVPLKQLFGRFPRLVRDLVASVGKQVNLEVAGEDTELDKTVIEKISDPLTHLIRNAIDHGLEPPHEREAAGKPAVGTIRLQAYQQGDSIYIEITDDGRGIHRERVIAKAVQSGLASPNQTLSDEEVFAFLFLPGFSTADQVTELSGRGVGMDVVRRNLVSLGGSITIRSEPGKGTRFRIQLPLTIAILDGQAVQVGDQTYLVPLVAILESIRPAPGSVHAVASEAEVVMIRGQAVPLIRIHRLFGVTPRVLDPVEGLVVLVEHDGRQAALLVDDVLGQQQLVIKSLEANFRKVEGIAGATILGDGHVALILDVAGLLSWTRRGRPLGHVA